MTDLDKLLQIASTDNISDELLAAYIDGNTTAEENEMIKASMPIEDLNDIAELSQDSLSFEEQLHFYDGDYGYWELGIPSVFQQNNLKENNNVENEIGASNSTEEVLYTNKEVAVEFGNFDAMLDNFITSDDSFANNDNFHVDEITDIDDNNIDNI
ncbi:MAG: hypothetical protein IJT35_02265 [Paludibacteraceae bacterium]|nr:hypothetical protein [Paludibacteraceae bacterium]